MAHNEQYWLERSKKLKEKNFKDVADFEKQMVKEYKKQMANIEKELNNFITKYAKNNKITFDEAGQRLEPVELDEYKSLISDYKEFREAIGDEDTKKLMAKLVARNKVTRFEYMQDYLQMEINKLSYKQADALRGHLARQYANTYGGAQEIVSKKIGIAKAFMKPSTEALKAIVNYPYSGEMFSKRIWQTNQKLVDNLTQTLMNGMVTGKGIDELSSALRKRMFDSTGTNYSTYDIRRIIRTESAFIQETAISNVNKDYGVEEYQLLTSSNCCENCAILHGRKFKESERKAGLNAPPFHPHCRCTTAPYTSKEALLRAEAKFLKKKKQDKLNATPNFTEDFLKQRHASLREMEEVAKREGFAFPDNYISDIGNKIENAPKFAKDLYEKFENEIKFTTFKSDDFQSWYNPRWQNITFDILDFQKTDFYSYQNTYFHEVGHLLDMKPYGSVRIKRSFSITTQKGKDFGKMLEQETEELIDNFFKDPQYAQLLKERNEYYDGIFTERENKASIFNQHWHRQYDVVVQSTISDIIGGVTKLEFHGRGGHDLDYWQNSKNVNLEAFAEFFAATMNVEVDKKELELIKQVFPKSYEIFKEICVEAVNR